MELDIAGFVVVATILVLAPGQDTILVVRNAAASGTRAGLLTTFGICCGLFVHASLSAVGLSALLAASSEAYAILKTLGAAYLVWLGLQSIRSAFEGAKTHGMPGSPKPSRRRLFREGILSNLLNAKTVTFYLALLPQFAVFPETVLRDSLFLAVVHFGLSFVWLGLVAVFADRARAWLATSRLRRSFDAAVGTALVGFGLRLGLSER